MAAVEQRGQLLHGLVPFMAIELQRVLSVAISCSVRAVAFDEFNLAIIPAELFHLLDRVTRLRRGYGRQVSLQISFRPLLEFAVNSLVVSIPIR